MGFTIGQKVAVGFKSGDKTEMKIGVVESFYDGKINVRFSDKKLFTLAPDKLKEPPKVEVKKEEPPAEGDDSK